LGPSRFADHAYWRPSGFELVVIGLQRRDPKIAVRV
jgi:hypothetical protein